MPRDLAKQRVNTANHYRKNKAYYKAKARVYDERILRETRLLVLSALSKGCIDCGEADPVVLDFDHRVGTKKEFAISVAMRRGIKVQRIKAEIEKCDVRCANCHRKITASQFNWWKANIRA